MSKMKTLKIGGSVFTITDNEARELIAALQKELTDAQSNITTLQEAADDARQDIDTVMSTTVQPDTSLSKTGSAADAKATGDAISQINNSITEIQTSISQLPASYVTTIGGKSGAFVLDTNLNQAGAIAEAKATGDKINAAYESAKADLNAFKNTLPASYVSSINGETGNVTMKIGVDGAQENHVAMFDADGNLATSNINLTTLAQISMTTADGENTLIVTPINL